MKKIIVIISAALLALGILGCAVTALPTLLEGEKYMTNIIDKNSEKQEFTFKDSFSGLDISVLSANANISYNSTNEVKVNYTTLDKNKKIECNITDGVLNVKEKAGFSFFSLFTLASVPTKIEISLPESYRDNRKLENADMMKQLETCLETRKEQIALMCESFSRYELIEPSDQHVNNGQISPDFIVCMLFAYLKQIYILDGMDKSAPVLKSVPRSNNGEIDAEILGDMERGLTSLHILADPTSGFLITPQSVRNRYFALRTTLYRSLWNYRMKGPKIQ